MSAALKGIAVLTRLAVCKAIIKSGGASDGKASVAVRIPGDFPAANGTRTFRRNEFRLRLINSTCGWSSASVKGR